MINQETIKQVKFEDKGLCARFPECYDNVIYSKAQKL